MCQGVPPNWGAVVHPSCADHNILWCRRGSTTTGSMSFFAGVVWQLAWAVLIFRYLSARVIACHPTHSNDDKEQELGGSENENAHGGKRGFFDDQ